MTSTSDDTLADPDPAGASQPDASSAVRWLSTSEQQVWRSFLHAQKLLADQLDRELMAAHELPHGYYEVLVHLSEAPGRRLRMSQLADASVSSRSRLSHAVSRLEQLGWVRREACPRDRRGFEAVLTGAGFAVLAAAAPVHVEGVRRHLFDLLSPEQVRVLGEVGAAVRAHLQGSPRSEQT